MKEDQNEVRIDKWLWAVRLFKTRSIATDACKKNRVMVGIASAKPSKMIHVGDIIKIRKTPITYSFKVLNLTEKRMGAKLVPDFLEDITPASELEILEVNKLAGFVDRAKGLGRPTKKDRRDLDTFVYESFFDDLDFDSDEESKI